MQRFFHSGDLASSDSVELAKRESHHAQHVMRLESGDEIELFNGRGDVAIARISDTQRNTLRCDVIECRFIGRTRPRLTIAAAAPKGDRLRWMIEKLTELGADRFIPLRTDRAVVHPGAGKLDKLRNTTVAAAAQCRRAWLMDIDPETSFESCLSEAANANDVIWLADADGGDFSALGDVADASRNVTVLVGPEGGWTEPERELAKSHGADFISLGPNILRVETAAVAAAAVICGRHRG